MIISCVHDPLPPWYFLHIQMSTYVCIALNANDVHDYKFNICTEQITLYSAVLFGKELLTTCL